MPSLLTSFRHPGRRGEQTPNPPAAGVEASRDRLLAAVGDPPDLTFVRGVGNRGDDLICAGTRQVLAGRAYREIALAELPGASGHTVILAGSGGWCRPYHELMPQMLPLAEQRFERVIVFPSSFDVAVDAVRLAVARTRATLFAREMVSYAALRGVCGGSVDVADDCAFFCDLAAYASAGAGRGVLRAFRDDAEALAPPPAGSVDISLRCASLDEWLWTIAAHAVVQTDRAHVMIAAARLGKRVEVRPSTYHKLPAIAAYSLGAYDVRPLAELPAAAPVPAPALSPGDAAAPDAGVATAGTVATGDAAAAVLDAVDAVDAAAAGVAHVRSRLQARALESLALLAPPAVPAMTDAAAPPRLTILVLTRDRAGHWPVLLRSIRDSARQPYRLLIVDNASLPAARSALQGLCDQMFPPDPRGGGPAVEIRWLERNVGCAVARHQAIQQVATDYVMFLDDDAELCAGAADHLVAALDANPAAVAAGAHLVLPDGSTQMCGGDYTEPTGGVLHFEPLGYGVDFADPAFSPAGAARACRWLAGAAVVFRRSALERDPIDQAMDAYYEDTEWCYRVGRTRPEAVFLSVPAALVLHHQEPKGPQGLGADELRRWLPYLVAIGHFYRVHGVLLDGIFVFAPPLAAGGRRDVAAARLLLELLAARGPDWVAQEWLSGGLAPLFQAGPLALLPLAELAALRRELAAERAAAAAERDRLVAGLDDAHRQLVTIHSSRLWKLADLYWHVRRAAARLAGRGRDT